MVQNPYVICFIEGEEISKENVKVVGQLLGIPTCTYTSLNIYGKKFY